MRNRTSTKKALLGSVVALVLCTALLLGTTFAWFTDSATATVGSITAGTLDVALVDANSKSISTLSFDSNAVWAPGNSNSLPTVYVKNNGNLEMKYKLTLATVSGDIDGLEWIVTVNGVETALDKFEGTLAAGNRSEAITVTAKLPSTVGNASQGQTLEGVTLAVVATQNVEDATYAEVVYVSDLSDLTKALANGNDVLATTVIQPAAGDFTLDGKGGSITLADSSLDRVINIADNTEEVDVSISNLTIDNPNPGNYKIPSRGISFFGNTKGVNFTLDNSTIITKTYYPINFSGQNGKNSTITATDSTISGWCAINVWTEGLTGTFENCTLIGTNIYDAIPGSTSNDFATIKLANDGTTVARDVNLTFTNCTIEANREDDTKGKQYFFDIMGEGATIVLENCTLKMDGKVISTEEFVANSSNYINASYSGVTFSVSAENGVITITSFAE